MAHFHPNYTAEQHWVPVFDRVHQPASQNPTSAYHIGRNVQGSLSAAANPCAALSCVPATTSWRSWKSFGSKAPFCSGQAWTRLGYAQGLPQFTGVTGTRMCLCCQVTQPLFPRPGPWKESNFLITSKLPKHSSNLCRKSLEPIPCPWAFLGVRNLPSHPSSLGRREGKLALGYFLGLLNFPLRPSSECAHMDHWWVAEASSVRSKVDYKILMSGCGSLSFFSLLLLGQYYRLNVWVTLQFIRWSLNQPVIVSVDKHGGN